MKLRISNYYEFIIQLQYFKFGLINDLSKIYSSSYKKTRF